MRTELLDPLADERWGDFLGRVDGATLFHHPAWLRLLKDHYRYEFRACCVCEDDGRVVAGLPWARIESRITGRRLVALPFTDACPPLYERDLGGQLAAGLEEQRLAAGLGLEVRAQLDALDGESPHRYWQHVLALESDADAVERRAKSSIRRGAGKARREGLSVERRTDPEALDAFYRLHLATRRHQGVPTQSKRFIDGLRGIFEGGHGFVSMVNDSGSPIAAAVFLHFRDHLIYKYGASDRSALARRPNNLLFADVIRWACENGFSKLDFGRTDLDNEGLRGFKRGWGAEELALHYTYVGIAAPDDGHSLPERLLTPVIRHSPTVVGRAIGAAFYRHFG